LHQRRSWAASPVARLTAVAVFAVGAATAPGSSAAQTPAAADTPAPPSSTRPDSVVLPPVTVTATRHKPRKPKPSPAPPANAAAPADNFTLREAPPVTLTTAGPVIGYRALTSVSATKTNTPIEQIPQSVVVIPRSVIDDQHPISQSEAFRNVSAVSGLPANEFLGYAYKVRGFPADRYVDGLPNYYDGGDFNSLINTERIEVLKGPAGILYQGGLGPVGGIINSVSKLPTASRSLEIGVMAGGYRLVNPWFDVNEPLNNTGTALFRVTGEIFHSHDYIDVIEPQRYSFNPTLMFDDHDGTALTIQGSFSRQQMAGYAGLPGAGTVDQSAFTIRASLFPGAPNLPLSDTVYDGVTVRFDRALDDVWSINAATRLSRLTLAESLQFPSSPNPALSPTPVFGSTFAYLNGYFPLDTREIAFDIDLIAKKRIGPTDNTFLIGADWDRVADQARFDLGFSGLVDLTNPVFPSYTVPQTSAFNANNTYDNRGVTAQLQSTVLDRLHLLAGVRLAHVRIHGTDAVAQSDFITDAWKPVPRLGAVYDLVNGISVFADYSEAFRGVPFFNAGTAPKPEEAQQSEAGLKLVLPSGLSGTLAFFSIHRENVMNLLPGSPFIGVQIGEQRSQGFDMDLIWQPLPGLSVLGSYAHINAYLVQDQLYPPGNKLDRVPADSGRLWANYKFQGGTLRNISVGAGLYAASSQASALDNLYFTAPFITFDAKIAYDTDQWGLALIGKNLADRRYFQPFPSGNGLIAPGEPLTVYALATLKYH
jgi:iron complex outermembrane receptor protein